MAIPNVVLNKSAVVTSVNVTMTPQQALIVCKLLGSCKHNKHTSPLWESLRIAIGYDLSGNCEICDNEFDFNIPTITVEENEDE